MSDQSDVCCTLCKADMATQFSGGAPTRTQAVISGNVVIPGPCFVADQITFQSPSMLIFNPTGDQPTDQNEYAVICRKLIVKGGSEPTNKNPCNPQDPGSQYSATNVITWKGRLTSAAAGAAIPPPAPQPPNSGLNGTNGQPGNPGSDGASPAGMQQRGPAKLVLVALEVEFLNSGNLVIDWAGQNGGDGGAGQLGGNAGSGTTGNNGSDESWPGSGCQTSTGSGGNGGAGGTGGAGGNGGAGAPAGQIVIVSSAQNVAPSGVFNNGNRFTYVTKSFGGKGGAGSHGGAGGAGGEPGAPSSSCPRGTKGTEGSSLITQTAPAGAPGASGASPMPNPQFQTLATGACAEQIARPLVFTAGAPQSFRRCSTGAGSGTLTLTGQFLDQIASVSTSLAGVTAAIDSSSTDTQLVLNLTIAANSASGVGDLIFNYSFPSGMTQTLAGVIIVNVCTASAIAPATGTHGTTVNVTITGKAFALAAPIHEVSVSGTGVTVTAGSVAVVDEQTMTCTFVIDAAAAKTARDVVVKAGVASNPCASTLAQSFTVT